MTTLKNNEVKQQIGTTKDHKAVLTQAWLEWRVLRTEWSAGQQKHTDCFWGFGLKQLLWRQSLYRLQTRQQCKTGQHSVGLASTQFPWWPIHLRLAARPEMQLAISPFCLSAPHMLWTDEREHTQTNTWTKGRLEKSYTPPSRSCHQTCVNRRDCMANGVVTSDNCTHS